MSQRPRARLCSRSQFKCLPEIFVPPAWTARLVTAESSTPDCCHLESSRMSIEAKQTISKLFVTSNDEATAGRCEVGVREVDCCAVIGRYEFVAVVFIATRDAITRSRCVVAFVATDVGQTTVLLCNALLVDEDAGPSCVDAVDCAAPRVTCDRNQSRLKLTHTTGNCNCATQVEVESCATLSSIKHRVTADVIRSNQRATRSLESRASQAST